MLRVLAGVHRGTAQQEYFVDANGMYLPKKSAVDIKFRIMLTKVRLKVVEEYSDFKRAAAAAAAANIKYKEDPMPHTFVESHPCAKNAQGWGTRLRSR